MSVLVSGNLTPVAVDVGADKETDDDDAAADPTTDELRNVTGATFEKPGNKIGIVSSASC